MSEGKTTDVCEHGRPVTDLCPKCIIAPLPSQSPGSLKEFVDALNHPRAEEAHVVMTRKTGPLPETRVIGRVSAKLLGEQFMGLTITCDQLQDYKKWATKEISDLRKQVSVLSKRARIKEVKAGK